MSSKILYVVHCVDTEGPLDETMEATFERLKEIFDVNLPVTVANYTALLDGNIETGNLEIDAAISQTFSRELLSYNRTWASIDEMCKTLFSQHFRNLILDDFGHQWAITWFCLDHIGLSSNPRKKALGFNVVHSYYLDKILENLVLQDELQLHYHPKSISGNPIGTSTSYLNSTPELIEIMARRLIDFEWFPTCFRPGYHAERQDLSLFLEQWIPFDFGNQSYEIESNQPDIEDSRLGDWRRASKSWGGYSPSYTDYQSQGEMGRKIFRCLNLGTRFRLLTQDHVDAAFLEASQKNKALLSFTDHDFRDILPDILACKKMLEIAKDKYPEVKIRFLSADKAARNMLADGIEPLELVVKLVANKLSVSILSGELFGWQPFLAIKTLDGKYLHDNFDIESPQILWSYSFEKQTIELASIHSIAVGAAGKHGGFSTKKIDLKTFDSQ